MRKILKQSFITLLLLVNVMFAADIPNSGTILNEIKPALKPVEKKALPVMPSQEYAAPITGDDTVKVLVKKFEIQNNTVFSTEVLHELIKEYEGKELTLLEIKKVAEIITKYYRSHGYFVARAYIPVQDLHDNIVKIFIIEGVYGTFNINNSSNVNDATIKRYLSKLDSQNVISMDKLERQILLINSLSGVQIVNAEIFPGKKVGSSDFTITAKEHKRFEGYAVVDNYGNKYTGEYRGSASGTINSPSGYGDALSVYVLNSFSDGLKYGHLSYDLPIGNFGMKTNIGASRLKYTLGDIYKDLDAYGDATVLEAGVVFPIIKTMTSSLDIQGQYEHRIMSDWMNHEDDKKIVDDFTVSLNAYKSMNMFARNGSIEGTVSFTQGYKSLKTQTAQINDLILKSEGRFSKANLELTYNQQLNEKTIFKTVFNAQKSFDKNLDSSQELSVCGPYGVRAYSNNELSGDQGFIFSAELLRNLPTVINLTHQAGLFYDTAKIWKNAKAWTGLTDNVRRLSDVGVSYSASYKYINFKASYACGFGSDAASVSGKSSNKLFAQLFLVF
ncbi:ShlB/FhaC/HecB family hemolysin secretion/activation protein [Sulfurimonas sp. HSL3-2]|uniref:ShlB/FhaC/HecB family hemolysin secretion/activation protein n=1 Tax=Hydrocurvibacter mobilis TaxID=3131936 RepID=UPI0031F733CA